MYMQLKWMLDKVTIFFTTHHTASHSRVITQRHWEGVEGQRSWTETSNSPLQHHEIHDISVKRSSWHTHLEDTFHFVHIVLWCTYNSHPSFVKYIGSQESYKTTMAGCKTHTHVLTWGNANDTYYYTPSAKLWKLQHITNTYVSSKVWWPMKRCWCEIKKLKRESESECYFFWVSGLEYSGGRGTVSVLCHGGVANSGPRRAVLAVRVRGFADSAPWHTPIL